MPILKVGATGNVKFPFRQQSIAQLLAKFSDSNKDLTGLNQEASGKGLDFLRNIAQSRMQNRDAVTNALSSNASRGTALSSNYAKQRAALAQQYNNQQAEANIDRGQFLNTDRIQRAGVVTDYNDLIRQLAAEETGYDPTKAKANEATQKLVTQTNEGELVDAQADIKAQNAALRKALMDQLLGIKDEANADLSRLGHGNVDLASNFQEYQDLYNQLIGQAEGGDIGTLKDLLRNERGLFSNRNSLIPQVAEDTFEPYGGGGGFGGFGGGFGGGGYGYYGGDGGYASGGGPTRDDALQESINALKALTVGPTSPGDDILGEFLSGELLGSSLGDISGSIDAVLEDQDKKLLGNGYGKYPVFQKALKTRSLLGPAEQKLLAGPQERTVLDELDDLSPFNPKNRNKSKSKPKSKPKPKSKFGFKKNSDGKKSKKKATKEIKKYGRGKGDDNNTSANIINKYVKPKPKRGKLTKGTKGTAKRVKHTTGGGGSSAIADREYEKREALKKRNKPKTKIKKKPKSKKERRDGGERKRKKRKVRSKSKKSTKKKKKKFKGKRRGPG